MFLLCFLLCSIYFLGASADPDGFDHAIANTSVWLSAAAYCETDTYLTRNFSGYSTGFVVRYVVDIPERDVQGYIGYMPSQSSIYVVFRGSTSIEDWIGNINVVLTDYSNCEGCEVHKGFYEVQQTASAIVLQNVKALRKEFPDYPVIVTGHSLGAAMALLTAIDLKENEIMPIRMFNFGSPRVGNPEFSDWASAYIVDHNRITHYRDIVVHLPNHHRFQHITGEWYEDQGHVIHACEGAEDSDCSYQFYFTNVADHMEYLTVRMGTEGCVKGVLLAANQ